MPCVQTTYDLFLIPLHYCCFELTEEKRNLTVTQIINKTNTHKKQHRLKKKKCID